MEKSKSSGTEFSLLMDKYFFSRKEIKKTECQFREELNALDIKPENILRIFISYMSRIFLGLNLSPFAPERVIPVGKGIHDWVLEIYATIFGNLFDELFASWQGYEVFEIRKQDFVAFLCGINNDPYDHDNRISHNYHNMAESREPILITGETGTGKELHAKLFHYLSPQRDKKLLALNCSGIPENLLESELFGHAKGAYTGATEKIDGILQKVGDGTLFLDEIGDMSPNLQAKILRVLETGDYYRVGGYEKKLSFEGRIIAATNKNLEAEILNNKPCFRSDLYYRISVFNVKLPSFRDLPIKVRETKMDYILMQLVYRYNIIGKSNREMELSEQTDIKSSFFNYAPGEILSENAKTLLLEYDYPGNYRELTNILKAALLNSGGSITVQHLPDSVRNYRPTESNKSASVFYDPLQVESVKLRDIVSHAEGVKRTILERKIELIYRNGKDIKNTLRSEGIADEKDYININTKITRIIGKDRLKALRISAKKDQRS